MGKKRNERKGLIYKVTNTYNGKIYIGQTINGLHKRKIGHLYDTFNVGNPNYNVVFHKAIRKYGKDSFTWEILEDNINSGMLDLIEMSFINSYDSMVGSNGYNMLEGGSVHRGSDSPNYKHAKYNFYHHSLEAELNVTQWELYQKYNILPSAVSLLTSGKRHIASGWVLDKKYLEKTFDFQHDGGRLIKQATKTEFRNITNEPISCTKNLVRHKSRGWIMT